MYQGRIAPSSVCCNPGRFLDKRRFTRINLRKQQAFRYPTSGGSRGAAGGARPPLFFYTKLRPERRKKKSGEIASHPHLTYLRVWITAPPPSPPLPYLKVWIRHCPLLISQLRLRNERRNSPYWWRVTNLIPRETRSGFAKSCRLFS